MTTNKLHRGHVFRPSLQDISLKRFRLRYCTGNDCYYLHWDDAACLQLAKINDLKNGVFSCSGIQRFDDGVTYLSCDGDAESAHIEWQLDFSCCGLVVKNTQIRVSMACYEDEDHPIGVEFVVKGDDGLLLRPQLGDYYTELNDLTGSSKLSLSATLRAPCNGLPPQFLVATDNNTSPLDIIIELMCPRPKEDIYCGEILLGIKFSSDEDSGSSSEDTKSSYILHDGVVELQEEEQQLTEGQLQIHIVEGAGLVDEDTHKPFNTVVKCNLLPDSGRFGTKQTSPRHNAYPTWTKNFIFDRVTKEELILGGAELILYDHHHFSSDHTIGGLRLGIPQRKDSFNGGALTLSESLSPERSSSGSPTLSPSVSPASYSPVLDSKFEMIYNGSNKLRGSEMAITSSKSKRTEDGVNLRKSKSKSMPYVNTLQQHSSLALSPCAIRRSVSPLMVYPMSGKLSPRSAEISPSVSPKLSPLTAAKNRFRLSGSHLLNSSSPRSSPKSSPLFGRKKLRQQQENSESPFVQWWMDCVTPGESNHWRQVLQNEGKWNYYWHCIRYKLKSVA